MLTSSADARPRPTANRRVTTTAYLRHRVPRGRRPPGADYTDLCRAGRADAEALIERMIVEDSPFLLGRTAKMLLAAPWSGRQVGFFQAIAERLR